MTIQDTHGYSFLHDKSEVTSCFKKFAKRAQNEFEVKLKKIRSDNGKEFDNISKMNGCSATSKIIKV